MVKVDNVPKFGNVADYLLIWPRVELRVTYLVGGIKCTPNSNLETFTCAKNVMNRL